MSSTWQNRVSDGFIAAKCIDGDKTTYGNICHTNKDRSDHWIRVDYGKPVTMAKIVITNRCDIPGDISKCGSTHLGATVSITNDAEGKKAVWADIISQQKRFTPGLPIFLTYT